MARGQFAEQIAVQIIHLRANEDSDPHPVAPNPAVSNHRNDLRRIRIENDVLGEDKVLSHVLSLKVAGRGGQRLRLVTIAPLLKTPLLT